MRKLDRRSTSSEKPAVSRTSIVCPSAGAKTPASRPQERWLSDSSGSGLSGSPNVPVFVR